MTGLFESSPIEFTGQVVLVTGAGGRPGYGMGRAIACGFAAAGAHVAAIDISPEALEETTAAISSAQGEVLPIVADVTDAAALDRAVAAVERDLGVVDVLVNHVGVGTFNGLTETDDEEWDLMLAANLTAPFRLSRRVLPGMLQKGSGVIVNTISICGVTGGRSGAGYTAAKHGLVGLTKNIATQYGPAGIRCVGVAPGSVRSDPGTDAYDPGTGTWAQHPKALISRIGEPEEVARVHLFLASGAASYVNGVVVPVDGGWTAV